MDGIQQSISTFQRYHQPNLNHSLSQINNSQQYDVQGVFKKPELMKDFKSRLIQSTAKTTYKTINWFKPKIQARRSNQQSSPGKGKLLRYGFSQKKAKNIANGQGGEQPFKTQHRLNKVIEQQLNTLASQKKTYLNLHSYDMKNLLNPHMFNKNKRIESPQKNMLQESPYSTYCINAFPKKQLKLTSHRNKLYPLKGQPDNKTDPYNSLGVKFRRSLMQKIKQIESEYKVEGTKNMLQMITIFSIKQHKKQKQQQSQLKKRQNPKKQHHNLNNSSLLQNGQQLSSPLNIKLYKRKDYDEQQLNYQAQNDTLYTKKIHSYMSFLIKVNYSNNMFIRTLNFCDRNNHEKVKVYVGEGNNKYLIIGLLKRRFWLEISNKINHDTKFIWTQNTIQEVHKMQSIFKLKDIKSHQFAQKPSDSQQESSKMSSIPKIRFNTLQNPEFKSPQQLNVNQFNQKIKKLNQSKYQSQAILSSQMTDQTSKKNLINPFKLKTKLVLKKQSNKKLFIDGEKGERANRFLNYFKINLKKQNEMIYEQTQTITNHVPRNSFIGSKKALFYTMQHYYRNIKKVDPFQYIPKTYHFKGGPLDQSYKAFLQNQKQVSQKSIWIVKPGQCTNRGKGITIMKASQISKKLLKKQFHANGQLKTTIVQSYITRPFLYNGRKFDIRHYMMITIINGNLKAYWYADGYLRTSSQIFNLDDLKDIYIHLTNDAIQITSQNYGKYQPGNKLSYNQLQRYLDSHYPKNKINFREQILTKMKDIATDIIKANYKNIDRDRRMNNFQIFGLDFMLDHKLKPWLIQVNANPCLQLNCPLLTRIIPIMVEHALRLGLDPLIMPTCHYPPSKRYFLSDNFIDKLKFQIIFDELVFKDESKFAGTLAYDFEFDQPQDQYENNGGQIDLAKLLD